MKTSKKLLLPATYTLFMSIGITFVLMQIYSGSFAESFSLNMTELGTLLSCQFIASRHQLSVTVERYLSHTWVIVSYNIV